MNKGLLMILISLIQLNGWAQKSKPMTPVQSNEQRIKEQANQMAACLLKNDMRGFAKFTYPLLIQKMGGDQKFIQTLEGGTAQMRRQGNTFMSIDFGEPTKIISYKKELQSTIFQTIQMKVSGGHVVSKSTLIAISTNNGLNWYFIEPPNQSIQEIQKAFPNLSNQLLIPPRSKPRFFKY